MLDPKTRVNDYWITDDSINASSDGCKTYKNSLIQGAPNSIDTRYQADFYQKIAVDVVAETVFNYPYAYISEKTLRSIACKRMFIIVGAPGTLKLLHSKGFDTFGDFIDESYDSIADPKERFLAIEQEIYRICSMPLETIKQYMIENSHKLESNFQVLQNLQNQELTQIAKDHSISL